MGELFSEEQLARLRNVIEYAARAGSRAVARWGPDAQIDMAEEEAAELIVSLSHNRRGRNDPRDVVNECADVIITALQAGAVIADANKLIDAIAHKTQRLELRLERR